VIYLDLPQTAIGPLRDAAVFDTGHVLTGPPMRY
jgi:hypothetical protein